ncbi:MAG TPA: hypothetical protein VJN18_32125 [Polyangiaceae bacterium]|nr:hypothetical protein [Polyangiaceae bacterium]
MNEEERTGGPFAALGIEPTLELARVKRAYFEAVARTPPYRDAAAFARVRTAYEQLKRPGGLEAAYLSAPLASSRELSALREHYVKVLAEAGQRASGRRAIEQRAPAFIEAAASTSLAAFIAARRRRD